VSVLTDEDLGTFTDLPEQFITFSLVVARKSGIVEPQDRRPTMDQMFTYLPIELVPRIVDQLSLDCTNARVFSS
jgi:hypothetical protein